MKHRGNVAGLSTGVLYDSGDFFDPVDLEFHGTAGFAAERNWVHPRIRAAMNGYDIHPMHYTTFRRTFDADPLSELATTRWKAFSQIYEDGAVAIIDDVDELVDSVNAAAGKVKADVGRAVRCNAYFSNGQYFGFKRHSDINDIFVLQGVGEKTWHVEVDGQDVPLHMKPGDLLFVPRYVAHRVQPAPGVQSVHISFTVDNHYRRE